MPQGWYEGGRQPACAATAGALTKMCSPPATAGKQARLGIVIISVWETRNEDNAMHKLTLSGAFALALLAGGSQNASAAPWCAWQDAYTYNCGFFTFEQCRATVQGDGGYCARNVQEPATAPRKRRQG